MDLYKKLKIKELLYSDLDWKLDKNDKFRIFHDFDDKNKMVVDFDVFNVDGFGIRVRLNNYHNGDLKRITITKYLYTLSSNMSLVSHLRKIRKSLLKERVMEIKLRKYKEDMKYLPKSLLRDLNINDILKQKTH
tara:strand:- start:78997 stop:79398 length:402 start_codon:yes stop_codon:yes gene_type:complete